MSIFKKVLMAGVIISALSTTVFAMNEEDKTDQIRVTPTSIRLDENWVQVIPVGIDEGFMQLLSPVTYWGEGMAPFFQPENSQNK